MKKHEFQYYNIIDCFGGRSLDTVQDSDIEKTLYRLHTLCESNLKGLYNLNSGNIETLFKVSMN